MLESEIMGGWQFHVSDKVQGVMGVRGKGRWGSREKTGRKDSEERRGQSTGRIMNMGTKTMAFYRKTSFGD